MVFKVNLQKLIIYEWDINILHPLLGFIWHQQHIQTIGNQCMKHLIFDLSWQVRGETIEKQKLKRLLLKNQSENINDQLQRLRSSAGMPGICRHLTPSQGDPISQTVIFQEAAVFLRFFRWTNVLLCDGGFPLESNILCPLGKQEMFSSRHLCSGGGYTVENIWAMLFSSISRTGYCFI